MKPIFEKNEQSLQELTKDFGAKTPADGKSLSTLSDYRFTEGVSAKEIYWLNCATGELGSKPRHDKKHKTTWLALLSDGALAGGWFDFSILVLNPQEWNLI